MIIIRINLKKMAYQHFNEREKNRFLGRMNGIIIIKGSTTLHRTWDYYTNIILHL